MRLANRPAASARLGGSPSRVVYRARFSRSERRSGGAKSWTATLRFQSSGRFRHPRSFQYSKLFGLSWLARLFTSSCVLTSASCGLAKWITRPLWRRETGAVSPNLLDKTRFALLDKRRRGAKSARIRERTAKPDKSAYRRRDARNPISQQPRLTAALIIIAPHPDRPIATVVARLYVDIAGADSRHAFG